MVTFAKLLTFRDKLGKETGKETPESRNINRAKF